VNPPGLGPKVSVFQIRDRRSDRGTANPFAVPWRVAGRDRSRAFPTRLAAEQFRSLLITARMQGEPFDADTGLPVAWNRPETPTLFDWARRWVALEWGSWAPRTRRSALEALGYFLPAALRPDAPALRPAERAALRRYLTLVLAPAPAGRPVDPFEPYVAPVVERFDRYLAAHVPRLDELDRLRLAEVENALSRRLDGRPRGSSYTRYVKVARQCLGRAVELGVIPVDPWPPRPRGHASRKATVHGAADAVDVARLPSLEDFLTIADAMVSHQPASRAYRTMSEVMFYAGLRPSEVVDLAAGDCDLPERGWGEIRVLQANVGLDEPGAPKTRARTVPIPEALVTSLRRWVEANAVGDGFLFRTRSGRRPTESNWGRCLHNGCRRAGHAPIRPYDLRHACATLWLNAGVAKGEAARRLGHSVETLERFYVGIVRGDDDVANARIEAFLAAATPPPGDDHPRLFPDPAAGRTTTATKAIRRRAR